MGTFMSAPLATSTMTAWRLVASSGWVVAANLAPSADQAPNPRSTAGESTIQRLAPLTVSMASRRDPSPASKWAIATRPDGSTVQVRA